MKSGQQSGFVLVATLWMLAALAALASAYAAYSMRTASSASMLEERLLDEAVLRSAIELCAFRQLSWPKAARPDAGAFSVAIGENRVDVIYRSENARVDLNSAPREMLAGLLAGLGASTSAASFLADRIVAWRTQLDESDRQEEAAIYARAGLAYRPPGAPFDNALEISLLPGMSPALAKQALGFVTIFGSGKIDPFVAEPVVLAALPGMSAAVVNGLVAARVGSRPDAAALARIAGAAKEFVSAAPNDNLRAEIFATVGMRRVRAEVVLKIDDSVSSPYEILYWRDDFDG
jgi:general secretion pathway protein K